MTYVKFPLYTPNDMHADKFMPLHQDAQLMFDVQHWLRARIAELKVKGVPAGVTGVEVEVKWGHGLTENTICRTDIGGNEQPVEWSLDGVRIGWRSQAWREQNYADTLAAFNQPEDQRRGLLPHEVRIVEENAKRQADFEKEGKR